MKNLIEVTITIGKVEGEDVLITRIPTNPTDFAFEFKRVQFPVRRTFSKSINKFQGQSLELCGINLELPCFLHVQLYVACSESANHGRYLFFFPYGKTKYIVHYQALQ